MHSRVLRVMLVALLLAVAAGAALQVSFLVQQVRQLEDDQQSLLTALARFDALAADLSAAQAAYVAPGQPDAPWTERVSALSPQLTTTIAAIRALARSERSASAIQSMSDAMSELATADANAREYLRQEQDLLAADIVFGEARKAIAAGRAAAVDVAASERPAFADARKALDDRVLLIAAAAVAVWAVGVLVLLPQSKRASDATTESTNLARAFPERAPAVPPAVSPVLDLSEAADLCTSLSRIVTAAAIPDMLARAAALLDASGIIVWMGHGDELCAATAHGYNPRVISRLGSIPKGADNATAEAWRTGQLRTVAGDPMANGAIVAPMFSPEGCIGVLAAEVRHGREQDAATQAVTTMVAAQLATVLGTWPSAPPARAAVEA